MTQVIPMPGGSAKLGAVLTAWAACVPTSSVKAASTAEQVRKVKVFIMRMARKTDCSMRGMRTQGVGVPASSVGSRWTPSG